MTAPTSDDRREVAERMRGPFDTCECVGHTFLNGTLYGMQVCARDEMALRNGMRRLADLIDHPTYRITCMGSFTPSHDFTRWQCGRCGAYSFTPREWIAPRYCSRCGERLVRDDA